MRYRKNKTMKGGFWESITGMFTKKSATPTTTSSTTTSSTVSSPTTSSPATSTLESITSQFTGGRRRGTRRRTIRRTIRRMQRRTMKGGFSASRSINDIASTASSFVGNKTAQPQVWLGGRSRKHRHNRRCKH